MLRQLRNKHDSRYLIFVHHEGEPIQVFTDIINDILPALPTYSNIVGHVHGPTL